MFNLQVGVEHDDPAGEERERQLGAGGLDIGHWHRSGSQSGRVAHLVHVLEADPFVISYLQCTDYRVPTC